MPATSTAAVSSHPLPQPLRRGDLTLSGFVSSAIVVLALIGGTYWLSAQERSAQSWIAHTEEVLDGVAAARAHLVDMQNGVRGFVISGRDADLQPYETARSALRDDVARLRVLTADNPGQEAAVQQLQEQLQPRLAASDAVIAARRAGGFDAARAVIDRAAPAQQQQHLRGMLDAMEARERGLLAQRLADHDARLTAFWTAVAALILGLLAALSAMYVQIRRKQSLERALLEREEQFHAMTDSVTEYAILMLDAQGMVRSWNPGAQRIKGYAAEEIIGRHFSCFYAAEDVGDGKPARGLRQALETGLFADEGWRVRRDGSRFWASVAITPVRGADGTVTGFCKITRDLTERKAAEELLRHEVQERTRIDDELQQVNARLEALVDERTRALQGANLELAGAKERLEQLSARLISAQEEERRHVARELHDETGQALTLIRLHLAELSQAGGAAQSTAAQCVAHVDRAIAHIRGLSVRLRPPMLDDLGLADALEWLLEQQAGPAGWRTRLELPEAFDRLPGHIETACFRICQEALTNAARSAGATEVAVTLRTAPGELVMTVEDNGTGFDLDRYGSVEERKKHFGLVSMSERAGLAGGQFEIDTAPGRGTRVRVRFRLQ